MSKRIIEWAPREKRRAVNAAVGGNFLKSITEPVTNSDSALKNQAGISHAAGLVREILKLKVNDRLDTTELKARIPKLKARNVLVQLFTSGPNARLCRIVDTGSGMSRQELETNFGSYASAKAKGEKTRSLFGRGALDVLLYHDGSEIYSVKNGTLSRCKIYWEQNATCEVDELGPANKKLLISLGLPEEVSRCGTVVQFQIREGTPIPQEDQIIARISSFYMLRLIASDPNSQVTIERHRAQGLVSGSLSYDFPIGTVLGRFSDMLDLGSDGMLPVDLLIARSDVPLENDPVRIDRRENGLLFVDENDAVLDLTLLPEYDKNPYLKHMYGMVRITGIRDLLETKLEASDAEAVLTATRDGFDRRHEITHKLFFLVEQRAKPLYDKEEQRQRKGDSARSEQLHQRVREALKVLNQFNADETEEPGAGPAPRPDRTEAIYFGIDSTRLYAGIPRRTTVYVNLEKVNKGEIILFETDNAEIKVEPDSETVQGTKEKIQSIELTVTCDTKNQKGIVTALTLAKDGQEARTSLRILGVDDPPVFHAPEDIEFTATRYSGDPNRVNKAVLLVNLNAFVGMPEMTFWLEERVGAVSLGGGDDRLKIKLRAENLIAGHNVARVGVPFGATGWGQHATLCAKAARKDGKSAYSKCRLKFEHPPGNQKFSNFLYEDLGRPVLGDVAGDKLYVNQGYGLHRQIFGETEDDFNKRLEENPIAQLRAASVLVEAAVYHAATVKYVAGGLKGLHIDRDDPIGSLRPYLEESRMKLEPRVIRALAPGVYAPAKASL